MPDNSLWGGGFNQDGQLGTGTTSTYQLPPVMIIDDVQSFSAGYSHTLVIKNDNTVWAAGLNDHGQLGDGTTVNKISFVRLF
jgi:alpha-tubulin suppressor-like RCC1 family protein